MNKKWIKNWFIIPMDKAYGKKNWKNLRYLRNLDKSISAKPTSFESEAGIRGSNKTPKSIYQHSPLLKN